MFIFQGVYIKQLINTLIRGYQYSKCFLNGGNQYMIDSDKLYLSQNDIV